MSEHHDTSAPLPTNRELAADIKALSDKLGVETPTAGMNKASLIETLDRLRRELAARQPAPITGAVRAGAGAAGEASPLEPRHVASSTDASRSADERVAPGDASAGGGVSQGLRDASHASTGDALETRRPTPAEHDASTGDAALDLEISELKDERVRDLVEVVLNRGRDLFEMDAGPFAEPAREAAAVFIRGAAKTLVRKHPAIARALEARLGEAAPAAAAPVASGRYKVARGKSVTTRRGIRGPGEAVVASDFRDAEQLERLRVAGVLVRS